MKKILIQVVAAIIIVTVLTSCAANITHITATPGEVRVYASATDGDVVAGYVDNFDVEIPISALDVAPPAASENALAERTIVFNGRSYQTTRRITINRFLRHYIYDVYTYNGSDGETSEFYVVSGETDKIVGFRHKVPHSSLPTTATKTEAEFEQIATEALGEFMDTDYYEHVSVTISSEYNICDVSFYNMVGDIMVADSSVVEIALDGTVVAVTALPEPAILKALRRISNIDTASFDSRVETEARAAYPDYRRDDNEMYVDVAYNGVEISFRQITLDDDGRPVVVYGVATRLNYNVVYRGESATLMSGRGLATQESGVSQQTVYITVGLE